MRFAPVRSGAYSSDVNPRVVPERQLPEVAHKMTVFLLRQSCHKNSECPFRFYLKDGALMELDGKLHIRELSDL